MLENEYQGKLIRKIKRLLPGCHVLKNDEQYQQGIPDLTILYGSRWAILEVKRNQREAVTADENQKWFIDTFDSMSFGAFIYPENEDQVLHDLQLTLTRRRSSRVSQSI